MTSFAVKFQYQHTFSGRISMYSELDSTARNGLINYFNNPEDYGITYLRKSKENTMFLCVPNMKVKVGETQVEVLPNHYKLLVDGSIHKIEIQQNTKKLHKELREQHQLIELIENEAREGRIYTIQKFAETFENQQELPSARTIIRKLNTLAGQQIIRFFNDPEAYGIEVERLHKNKTMFMCMSEEMELKTEEGNVYVIPNYYKSAVDGSFCEL
jgi:Fe2+ or Zn2+ uptake regulation protein